MGKFPDVLRACGLAAALLACALPARAAYAPIPPVEQGRVLTLYVGASHYYDSNIFGAPAGGIDSLVFQLQPNAVFNFSVAEQTLLTASYQASIDYFDSRPGNKLLVSHTVKGRIAHTFSPRFEGEISDMFLATKNPETLMPGIAGVVLNPDQSCNYNRFEAKGRYTLTRRDVLKGVLAAGNFFYQNPWLRQNLNHGQYTAGVQAVHAMRENLQTVAEYRLGAVRYAHDGWLKNKDSHTLLAGADYAPTKLTACTARLGIEALFRKGAPDAVLPYVELAVKRDFFSNSYVSAGYTFAVQETSDVSSYTDMYSHHFFVNAQYGLARNLVLTALCDWQPARLNGRAGVAPGIHENTLKAGGALTCLFGKSWSFSFTCDYDSVRSGNHQRNLNRVRTGIRGRWVF